MIRRGRIYGIGLSSIRKGGKVTFGVSVDGKMIPECEIIVNTTTRSHDIFDTEFIVIARSIINFVCLSKNESTENTVALLLIQLY